MGRGAPDRTLSEIEALLAGRGDEGLTLFRSPDGWRANIKRNAGGFHCGSLRPTLAGAVAQVFGEEPQEPVTEEWEDLI